MSRTPRYIHIPMKEITDKTEFRVKITPKSPERCLQVEVSTSEPSKFGGQFLAFFKLNQTSTTLRFRDYYDNLVFTFYEGTNNQNTFTISTEVGTRESEEWISNTPRPPQETDESIIPSSRGTPTTPSDLRLAIPILFVCCFVVGVVIFAVVFYCVRKRKMLQTISEEVPDEMLL